MPFRALPPQDKLREMFDYDPDTGILLNKRLNRRAGFVLGGGNSTGAFSTPEEAHKALMVYYQTR